MVLQDQFSDDEFDEEVRAINEALDGMDAGDKGQPAEQVVTEIREMLQLTKAGKKLPWHGMTEIEQKWRAIVSCLYDTRDEMVERLGYEALSVEPNAREVIRATIVARADDADRRGGQLREFWRPTIRSIVNTPTFYTDVWGSLQDFPFAEPDNYHHFTSWVWDELFPGEDWREGQPSGDAADA